MRGERRTVEIVSHCLRNWVPWTRSFAIPILILTHQTLYSPPKNCIAPVWICRSWPNALSSFSSNWWQLGTAAMMEMPRSNILSTILNFPLMNGPAYSCPQDSSIGNLVTDWLTYAGPKCTRGHRAEGPGSPSYRNISICFALHCVDQFHKNPIISNQTHSTLNSEENQEGVQK